jgi:hypothetical protein
MTKTFDLLLAYSFFRHCDQYLNLVVALSKNYKIGLTPILIPEPGNSLPKAIDKVRHTNRLFEQLLIKEGAELTSLTKPITTKILIFPEGVSTEIFGKQVNRLREMVIWDKFIFLLRFLNQGFNLQEFVHHIRPDDCFVVGKYLSMKSLGMNGKQDLLSNLPLKEVGVCHFTHPAPLGLSKKIDYLVAFPSFTYMNDRLDDFNFLEELITFLDKLDKNESVVIKEHNHKDEKTRFSQNHLIKKHMPCWVAKLVLFFSAPLVRAFKFRKGLFLGLTIQLQLQLIDRTYKNLSELTPYSKLNIEQFLPYVKKGVVVGVSQIHFYALANKLKVYNCDRRDFKIIPKLRSYDYEYLVPFWQNTLIFDEAHFDRIPEAVKNNSIVSAVLKYL